jgi:hypothetical protein
LKVNNGLGGKLHVTAGFLTGLEFLKRRQGRRRLQRKCAAKLR